MSKILIITANEKNKKVQLLSLLRKNFHKVDTQIHLGYIKDVSLYVNEKEINLYFRETNFKDYDLIYFRGIPKGAIYATTTIAEALESIKIKYFDTLYQYSGPHRSKLGSLVLLAANGLPIPKTICFFDNEYEKHFRELEKALKLPFVAKELSQQRGRGVYLIKNISDLEKLSKENNYQYFFQEHIEKDHEYRVLVLGNEIGVWEEKINNNKDDFRNNVAVGAEETFFNSKDTPENIKKPAILAAQTLSVQVAGVDIMTEKKTGKVYLLEVNRGPGFTYDAEISPEFKQLANFLEQEACTK